MADDGTTDAGQEGQEGGEQEQPQERTFTQAELDRIVQDRVARVKREAPADYEELKAKAAQLEELETAKLSELEQEKKAREKAEKQAAEAMKRANERLLQAEILAEATAQQAIRPEHLHRLIDTDTVTIGDDGQVTGVQDAVKAFLEANPEYVGTSRPAGPVDQGARGTTPKQLTRDDLKDMSPDEINKAREEGRLDRVMGITK